MSEPARSQHKIHFGDFEVNLLTAELRHNGRELTLQGQPFQILIVLLQRPGELVTREELKKRLWTSDTFVDFEHSLNKALSRLRDALDDNPESPKFVETLRRKGYRWIGPPIRNGDDGIAGFETESGADPTSNECAAPVGASKGLIRTTRKIALAVGGLSLAFSVTCLTRFGPTFSAPPRSEKGSVVLANFVNTTGDPIFDDTLKQGLSVQLSQSPFFDVLPDQRISETLKLMGRAPDDRLTPGVAREVCVRTNSKVMLEGSISNLGRRYVVGLKALNCDSGEIFGQLQAEAAAKEEVLKVLGQTTTKMRQKLGESLSSVRRFNVPDQVTTPSLEALKAWSTAEMARAEKGDRASLPFFRRAIELDPNFAMAHAKLATVYVNLQENALSTESIKRAFELRDRVSEKERFYIESHYYQFATREFERANEVYELWARTYPRSGTPLVQLAGIHFFMGRYEIAVTESLEALRRDPHSYIAYTNLMLMYTAQNRLNDARATYLKMRENGLEYPDAHVSLYAIAAAQMDQSQMHSEVAWADGKLGIEDSILAQQADTEAFHGRLREARDFSRRATESGRRAGREETAAFWEMNGALNEAAVGNRRASQLGVALALARSPTRDVQTQAALSWAQAGNIRQAQKMSDDLARLYPLDTMLNGYWLPTIRAAIELDRKNPNKAIEFLHGTASYELGGGPFMAGSVAPLYPAYLRGQAYLQLRRGKEAMAEYRKFLDHWGTVRNCPLAALARLGLGRAYAMQGHSAEAHVAYQDFFALWKDADADIPVLKQAKAEYAKLQ